MTSDPETWERERLLEALDSFGRGLADAPSIHKWASHKWAGSTQMRALGEDAMTFVVSTQEPDRYGDIVSLKGWRLEAYRENPVVLWAHHYTRPAIGRATKVWTDEHSLLATVDFAPTEFAQEVATLYHGGYQRGVSVGFRPLKYELRRDKETGKLLGINYIEQELLEISAAPVPVNPSALRKALESTPRMQG